MSRILTDFCHQGRPKTVTSRIKGNVQPPAFDGWKTRVSGGWLDTSDAQSVLNCIFQPTRHEHVSGRPDILPFENLTELQLVFDTLKLPSSYFQIASGSVSTTHSHTFVDSPSRPCRYEMIAHLVSRQGDKASALSHDASKQVTSVFWSVDKKIDTKSLLDDFHTFQVYASHPMLIPCIMFASSLRTSEECQRTVKVRLTELESTITRISVKETQAVEHDLLSHHHHPKHSESLESLLQTLHGCRKEQSSRKGRYKFWQSVIISIDEGFKYVEALLVDMPDAHLLEAHLELMRWVSINKTKLEGLMARDEDHVYRVENVSHMVGRLIVLMLLRLLICCHSFTASLGSGTYASSLTLREPYSGTAKI